MADRTGISWTDRTFNPWIGCTKVSPGCAHCYAETLVHGRMGRADTWGDDGRRDRTAPGNWRKPVAWDRESAAHGRIAEGGGRDERLRVFCASLADVFEPRPELDPWRHDLFALIEATPHLDWQLLTKRPEEARDWLRTWWQERRPTVMETVNGGGIFEGAGRTWTTRDYLGWGCLPNLWVGTSIESSRFTWRADVLREIPVAVRFISAEPLLGSLFVEGHGDGGDPRTGVVVPGETPLHEGPLAGQARLVAPLNLDGIDWVIVGGESGGRNARPMHPDWAREIRDAVLATSCGRCGHAHPWSPRSVLTCDCGCLAEGWIEGGAERRALHFKQQGSYRPALPGGRVDFTFPEGQPMHYAGPGPKSGGKLLDGTEWCEFPTSPAAMLAPV